MVKRTRSLQEQEKISITVSKKIAMIVNDLFNIIEQEKPDSDIIELSIVVRDDKGHLTIYSINDSGSLRKTL